MPRSIAALHGPEIVTLSVGPEPLTWPVALVWRARRRQPPAAKAFLAIALEAAKETAQAGAPARLAVA
jgi:DNA-binding transcriptional LysR family regulator